MYISIQRDGLTLNGRLDAPSRSKFPLVILLHGFGGSMEDFDGSIFSRIAAALVEKGIGVMRFDFNGHGKSDGDFSRMNIFNEINDAIAMLEYAKAQSYTEDIYIVGHSQGGVVAGMLAGLFPDVIKKLVLLAPAASLKADAQQGRCFNQSYDTNSIPDTVNVDGSHIVGGHYFRIAKNLPIYEITKNFTHPALAICGLDDTVVSKKAIEQYQKELENCRIEYMHVDHGLWGKDTEKMLGAIAAFLSTELPLPQLEEVLSIDVKINNTEEVATAPTSVRIISFTGSCDTPFFKGEIAGGGADTQIIFENITSLSARYILNGTDSEGKKCSVFIENNGQIIGDGAIYTTPKIITDSKALKELETSPLSGRIYPTIDGVRVVISRRL